MRLADSLFRGLRRVIGASRERGWYRQGGPPACKGAPGCPLGAMKRHGSPNAVLPAHARSGGGRKRMAGGSRGSLTLRVGSLGCPAGGMPLHCIYTAFAPPLHCLYTGECRGRVAARRARSGAAAASEPKRLEHCRIILHPTHPRQLGFHSERRRWLRHWGRLRSSASV